MTESEIVNRKAKWCLKKQKQNKTKNKKYKETKNYSRN